MKPFVCAERLKPRLRQCRVYTGQPQIFCGVPTTLDHAFMLVFRSVPLTAYSISIAGLKTLSRKKVWYYAPFFRSFFEHLLHL